MSESASVLEMLRLMLVAVGFILTAVVTALVTSDYVGLRRGGADTIAKLVYVEKIAVSVTITVVQLGFLVNASAAIVTPPPLQEAVSVYFTIAIGTTMVSATALMVGAVWQLMVRTSLEKYVNQQAQEDSTRHIERDTDRDIGRDIGRDPGRDATRDIAHDASVKPMDDPAP